jgi:hypothetical protein
VRDNEVGSWARSYSGVSAAQVRFVTDGIEKAVELAKEAVQQVGVIPSEGVTHVTYRIVKRSAEVRT